MAVLFLLLRLPAILSNVELNIDESGILAQAMKYLVDPVPWRSVDGTTNGPIVSWFVSVFLAAGIRPGFVMLHAIAAFALFLLIFSTYRTLLRLTTPLRALLGVLPALFAFAVTDRQDYLHFSSELAPALCLAFGFHWFVRARAEGSPMLFFLAGIGAGLAPWGKLQALPMSGGMGLLLGYCALRRLSGRTRATVALGCGLLLPSVVVLRITGYGGALYDFWLSYVLQNLNHLGAEPIKETLKDCVRVLGSRGIFPISWLVVLLIVRRWAGGGPTLREFFRRDSQIVVAVIVYCATTLLAVTRPATYSLHYTIFLLNPMLCLLALAMSVSLENPIPPRKVNLAIRAVGVSVLVAYGFVVSLGYARFVRGPAEKFAFVPHDPAGRVATAVRELGIPVKSIAIWGWVPGVYIETGIPPATRDAVSYFLMVPGPLRPYFRKRFVQDIRTSKPDVFIDAVAAGTHNRDWPFTNTYESDPGLKQYVEENYVLVRSVDIAGPPPARIFVRR